MFRLRTLATGIIIMLLSTTVHAALQSVGSLRWQHRIIVVAADDEANAYIAALNAQKSWLDDRDILWFVVDTKTPTIVGSNSEETLAPALAKQLSSTAYLGRENSRAILIGKDGGVKDRATQLDLNRIYDLIDRMPMRKREMGERS